MILITCLALALAAHPREREADGWMQYATPEEAGFDSQALERARNMAELAQSGAVVIVYRGHVLCAWGQVERRFKCHTLRGPLLLALLGSQLTDGTIQREATLAELEIDDLQELNEVEQSARVVDLLRSRSGVYHPAAMTPEGLGRSRPARGSHAPGEHYWQNDWDLNVLLKLLERTTGVGVFEDFHARIAVPTGMQEFRPADGLYRLEPSPSKYRACAFRMSARDLARFGQLYLQNGRWLPDGEDAGEVLVPAEWIAESTRAHSKVDEGAWGYSWRTFPAGSTPAPWLARIDAVERHVVHASGGTTLVLIPEHQLVAVHMADTDNGRRVGGATVVVMLDRVLRARTGEEQAEPELVPLAPVPLAEPGPLPESFEPVALDTERAAAAVGSYRWRKGYVFELFLFEDRLFVRSPGGEVELYQSADGRYFSRAAPLAFEVRGLDAGRPIGIVGRLFDRQLSAGRVR